MNTVTLIGNLCRDNELRYTTTGTQVLENALAVKREMKNKDGEYESDFVTFTVFGKTAEFLHKYTAKGDTICVVGKLRVDKYTTKEGEVRYKQYVRGSSVEILKHKQEKTKPVEEKPAPTTPSYENVRVEDLIISDEELPF